MKYNTQFFTIADLQEAHTALLSTQKKCEKVLPKLKEQTSAHTLLTRRIKALKISLVLIEERLKEEEHHTEL